MGSFELLDRRVQGWIWRNEWQQLRQIQERSIRVVLERERDLIIAAATAAGKTEAAFLPIVSNLCEEPAGEGIGAVYVSPLKALINDQHQRLETLCEAAELDLASWHGDIAASVKRRVREHPRGVLMITPESLESIFVNHGTHAPRIFGALRYVVIDELHAFVGSERGRQLQSLLNRIELAGRRRPMRIGLSATLGEMRVAAEFMRPGAGEEVELIESDEDGRELRVQLRGYRSAGPEPGSEPGADEDSEPEADRLAIAAHLYKALRGTDNLVFANSRGNVEEFADLLRRRSESERVPNEFLPHHGNLAKALREEVEEMLRSSARPTTAICTSTLELGIDVGSVASVAQIDPPFSAAALRQRLGRSGRQPGDPSVLRMYVTESELEPGSWPGEELREALVQSIALIEALIDGWFEPPIDGALHLSALIQQVLSVIAQHGGARADQLWSALCGSGPFDLDQASFAKLLRGLAEREVIQQSGDRELILSARGEQIVGHHTFYTAFVTSEEYRLVADGKEIGSMPLRSPLTAEAFLIFGGRRWQVIDVDEERRVISVKPARGGKVPRFIGGGGQIHDGIRRRMRSIYQSHEVPAFLDGQAKSLLVEGRWGFRQLCLDQRQIVPFESGSAYFPWRGDRAIDTLVVGIRAAGLEVEARGLAVLAPRATPTELRDVLAEVFGAGREVDAVALAGAVKNLETEKHHWLLDRELLLRDCAVANFDVAAASAAVADLPPVDLRAEDPADTVPPRKAEEAIFTVVDCETTGLHPNAQHRIVELALLSVDAQGRIIERWSSLLRPERDLGASWVHGVHGRELLEAPSFAEVLGDVRDRIAGRVLVAHNARFDQSFLESELVRCQIQVAPLPMLCTMELASRLAIGGTRRRLEDCCASLGFKPEAAHAALGDAEAAAAILAAYLERYGAGVTSLAKGMVRPVEEWPKSEARAATKQRTAAFAERSGGTPLSTLVAKDGFSPASGVKDAAPYVELLERAIEDRHLNEAETEELDAAAQMLGLDPTEAARLNCEYVDHLVGLAWRDGEITEREREDLYLVSRALGVDDVAERLAEHGGAAGRLEPVGESRLQGKTACFTGGLTCHHEGQLLTRERATALATAAGLTVLPRVTKKLDILVLADPNSMSGKARKAQEYGTRLIAETAFWELIGVEVT